MRKIVIFITAIVLVFVAILIFARRQEFETSDGSKLKITASFYTLAEFAKQVGGGKVEVKTIIPAGVEPHEYEPTPKDIAGIYSARLFLYQGGDFDRWAGQVAGELRSRDVAVVPMTEHFSLRNNNPHIWLDPVLAQKEIEIIRDALMKIDPQNADMYARNSARYLSSLAVLDEEYKKDLAFCETKEIVALHPAFQYLADRYGLSLIAIVSSPEQEVSLRKMAEIVQLVRAKGIKRIFAEPLDGSKIPEAIARETDSEVLTLNPVEGLTDADIAAGKSYLSIMEENLKNLRAALLCNAK